MFFVHSEEIISKNCDISTKVVQKQNAEKFELQLRIPISKFNSENQKRDTAVQEILKMNVQPDLLFSSKEFSKEEFIQFKTSASKISGTLSFGGNSYPVDLDFQIQVAGIGFELDGILKTNFGKFGIEPPTVGPGGAIAKAKDILELHYHLQSTKTEGFDLFLSQMKQPDSTSSQLKKFDKSVRAKNPQGL